MARVVLFLSLCLWAIAATVSAQSVTLSGRITDEQGAAMLGATVTVAVPGALPLVELTDATGTYGFATLLEGTHTVTFAMPGFVAESRQVTLTVALAVTVNAQLRLAPFSHAVDVVGVAPVGGAGLDRARLPATVSVITASDLDAQRAPSFADALNERLGGIALEGTTANLFQPTLRFRGFTASPLLGLPQGVAVYQNGARINEPFGDTVQFDLIPQFAIGHAQLSAGADPTYGLNALGGALSLRLKDGFNNAGFRGEVSGGSFGRYAGTAEFGVHRGPWALYLGGARFDESGWRAASPSEVTQAVTDLAFRKGPVDAGVTVTVADSRLNGNSAAPVELLAVDRAAVFTFPDITDNRLAFVQGRVNVVVSPVWSIQMRGFLRNLERRTLNGDEAGFSVCEEATLPLRAPESTLCFGGAADDAGGGATAGGLAEAEEIQGAGGPGERPLVDIRTGRFITADDAAGDGAFNRTTTGSTGYGATLQVAAATDAGGRDNRLTLGLSADLADVDFLSNSEIGTLTPERTVSGSGLLAGLFGEAPDDQFNAALKTTNRALGVYVSDTLSLTERVHVTMSGRLNDAKVEIVDLLGPSLNGNHRFTRFNAAVGGVVDVSDTVSVFGRYSESNRAPTAAELSCADPDEPCRVPNAFVSDPRLDQVVARSVEGGVRGRTPGRSRGTVDWSVTAYRTAIADDIIFIASPELIGTGFFQNAGDTRRAGLDVELSGGVTRLGWFVSYGMVEATFESPLALPGNPAVNDAASADGTLAVDPGDRLPGIPRHNVKAGVRYSLTEAWDLALDALAASSRVFVGDESNDQPELAGYGIANLRSVYRVTDGLELFVRIDNLFGKEYETFGVLADLELFLSEAENATIPRFVTPGAPRSGFTGVQFTF